MSQSLTPVLGLSDIVPDNIPERMKALPFWNVWKLEERKGKTTKTPLSIRTGRPHNVQDTEHLGTISEALEAAQRFGAHGIGFSFIKGCGLVGLDFDHSMADGALHQSVAELVDGLGYAEVSPSGTGIKVIVRADVDFVGRNRLTDFPAAGIETEMYNWGRYFTVTGKRIDALSAPFADMSDRVRRIHQEVVKRAQAPAKDERQPTRPAEFSDRDIMDAAFRARNGADIAALYRGDWRGRYESQSQADQALCNHLAFYTGNDTGAIDRLFRSSGLYRDKWDKVHVQGRTYGAETISNAVAATKEVYSPGGERSQGERADDRAELGDEPEEFGGVIPLDSWDTPEWPGLFPSSLEQFTDAVSEMNQTPRAQSKMMCIPVLSAGVQEAYQINICGRVENLATFVGVTASTGERKSSDLRIIKAPLVEYERSSYQATKDKLKQDTYERELLSDRVEKLKREAVKTGDEEAQKAYFDARSKLDTLGETTAKRLLAQDITPEKLAALMREQAECIALISAEGGPLEDVKGRYQTNATVSNIFLQGFSGEEVTIDRKKDQDPIKLLNPSLTMGIMTQPGHLASILADRDFKGRGLLERFLWCIADERIGYRGRGRAIPHDLTTAYHRTMRKLLPTPGYRTPDDESGKRTLHLSEEGIKLLNDFALDRLEPRLRPGGDLRGIRGCATRLPTAAVKLATLSHIYAAAERDEEVPGLVATEWVEKAIRWVELFAIPMALKTFGLMGSDPGIDMAGRILLEIQNQGYTEFRRAEFKQRHFKGTPAAEVRQGYEALLERNYLRLTRVRTNGRTAEIYEVNPAVFSMPETGREIKGEEGTGREKKGGSDESQPQIESLNPLNGLSTYKADLDPFSSTKYPDNHAICSYSDTTPGIKGIKGKKGPESDQEASLDDLLEGEDLAL